MVESHEANVALGVSWRACHVGWVSSCVTQRFCPRAASAMP